MLTTQNFTMNGCDHTVGVKINWAVIEAGTAITYIFIESEGIDILISQP